MQQGEREREMELPGCMYRLPAAFVGASADLELPQCMYKLKPMMEMPEVAGCNGQPAEVKEK